MGCDGVGGLLGGGVGATRGRIAALMFTTLIVQTVKDSLSVRGRFISAV